jgi:hypothetical protein
MFIRVTLQYIRDEPPLFGNPDEIFCSNGFSIPIDLEEIDLEESDGRSSLTMGQKVKFALFLRVTLCLI